MEGARPFGNDDIHHCLFTQLGEFSLELVTQLLRVPIAIMLLVFFAEVSIEMMIQYSETKPPLSDVGA